MQGDCPTFADTSESHEVEQPGFWTISRSLVLGFLVARPGHGRCVSLAVILDRHGTWFSEGDAMDATVADVNPKTLENAKRQFVELYGSALVLNTYLKIALVLVSPGGASGLLGAELPHGRQVLPT